jgi:putative colanic acid biosynthesis acetyltransferase WcaF
MAQRGEHLFSSMFGMAVILSKDNPFEGPSFSSRNRFARIAWQITWLILFRSTPAPLHGWRCWLLRCFGARIASGCHVYSDVMIWAPWNLQMSSQSCLGRRVICYSMAPVSLGERAVVSQGVHLCTGSHDYESENFQLFARPIVIGADAWICAEAFLSPGVSVGNGAVIGARAVVTRDQPAWMVCAGNPCRPLKPRTPPAYVSS